MTADNSPQESKAGKSPPSFPYLRAFWDLLFASLFMASRAAQTFMYLVLGGGNGKIREEEIKRQQGQAYQYRVGGEPVNTAVLEVVSS